MIIMNDFIIISKDYPITQDSKTYAQIFSGCAFRQPKHGEIFEEMQRIIIDVIELTNDYPRMLGESILVDLAKSLEFPFYTIVEDTFDFENGLLLIGYETEEACKGYDDYGREIDHIALDLDELQKNRVHFNEDEDYYLFDYCKDHKHVGIKGKYTNTRYILPFEELGIIPNGEIMPPKKED